MEPADFYYLACRDRPRAARALRAYDGPGLRQFADGCAQHLFARFAVRIPLERVLTTWQRAALISEQQMQAALALQERAVGE